MKKLWGGRFSQGTDRAVERFTHSFSVDCRLARQDLSASIAHARMLGKTRIIPRVDARKLVRTLQQMLRQLERGSLRLKPSAEDVHTAIQSELDRRLGPTAGRLHTARSRNDQVVTSFRLYCRDALRDLDEQVLALQKGILRQAESVKDLVMPGYTHIRHAQPVLAAHVLLSYLEMLQRDRDRFCCARWQAMSELPLGAGALVGTGLRIDRASVARELGFEAIKRNSMDAVTDRDFAVEILSALALLSVHLSRVAEELILWSTAEFGFLQFEERVLTGSSMMPQKQNPDFLELTRAGSARIIGGLSALLTVLKGLPTGYQRDLQLDKEILFEALDRMTGMLEVVTAGLRGARWNRQALESQLQDESLYATDLAEYLVQRGVPFAEAHRAVGRLLAHADRQRISLRALPLSVYQRFSRPFGRDVFKLLSPAASVRGKRSAGSTHPAEVARQIRRWKKLLR